MFMELAPAPTISLKQWVYYATLMAHHLLFPQQIAETGHMLGASSVMGVITSVLGMQSDWLPPHRISPHAIGL